MPKDMKLARRLRGEKSVQQRIDNIIDMMKIYAVVGMCYKVKVLSEIMTIEESQQQEYQMSIARKYSISVNYANICNDISHSDTLAA